MRTSDKRRSVLTLLGGVGCALAACSVDTGDITWRPDSEFDLENLGGVLNDGGVLNKAGNKGKAGSDGGDEGGEGNVGNTGGSISGGSDAGGRPTTGGAAGTPAVGGNNAGNGGGGGMPPANGYPCKAQVKPGPLIADFTGVTDPTQSWKFDGITFGTYAYPPDAAGILTLMPKDGVLTAKAKVDRPMGFGIWFTPCADAKTAGFAGIVFQISGFRNDGQPLVLRAGVGINANRIADPNFQEGGCVPPMGQDGGYCRAASYEITIPPNGPPGMEVGIVFEDFRNGNPATTVDPTQITSVEWGFVSLNGQPAYDGTLSVDNVGFK